MEISATYPIEEFTCRCKACGLNFRESLPAGYELVQFACGDGQTRYLPAYGPGGYLDLLEQLVPGWTPKQTVTVQVSGMLTQELSKRLPYPVELYSRADIRCPSCGGQECKIEREQTVLRRFKMADMRLSLANDVRFLEQF